MSARRVIPTFNIGNNAGLVALSGAAGKGFSQAGNTLANLGVDFAKEKHLQDQAQKQAIEKQNAARALVQSNRILNPDAVKLIETDVRTKNPYSPDSDITTMVDSQLANLDFSSVKKESNDVTKTIIGADNKQYGVKKDGQVVDLGVKAPTKKETQPKVTKLFDYTSEDGHKYARMSDGSVVKSKNKVQGSTAKSKEVMMYVEGFGMTPMVPIQGESVTGVTIEKGGINYAPKAWVEKQIANVDDIGNASDTAPKKKKRNPGR